MTATSSLHPTIALALFAALSAAAWGGCSKNPNPAGAYPVGGGPVDVGDAIESLTTARCDREQRCGNVGQGKTWASRDECIAAATGEETERLRAQNCPMGAKPAEINDCLGAIQGEGCNAGTDWVVKLKECRASEMCR